MFLPHARVFGLLPRFLSAFCLALCCGTVASAVTFENSSHQMAAGNFNLSDASNEVVFINAVNNWGAGVMAGEIYVHDFNTGFSQVLPGVTATQVVAANIDGVGADEVVFIDGTTGFLRSFNFATNTFSTHTAFAIQDVTAGQIDGDVQIELLVSASSNTAMSFFDPTTNAITSAAGGGAGNNVAANFNNNGLTDFAVRNGPNNGSGELFSISDPYGGFVGYSGGLNRIATGDLDGTSGDTTDEVYLTNAGSQLFVHRINAAGFTQTTGFGTDPTVGHVQTFGDGRDLAFVIGAGDSIYQGTTSWNLTNTASMNYTFLRQTASINGSMAVGGNSGFFDIIAADINGDGLDEILGRKTVDGGSTFYLFSNGDANLVQQNVFLKTSDSAGTSSFNSALNWSNAQAPQAGINYDVGDGRTLRTPAAPNPAAFAGDSLNVYTGGTLSLDHTGSVTINNLNLNGGTVLNNGTNTLAGTINLVSQSEINTNGILTVTSTISGSGGYTKTGGAGSVLYVEGANTYTGVTTVQNGYLVARNSSDALGAGGAGNGTVVLNGATLQLETAGSLNIANENVSIIGNGVGGARGALANWTGNNIWGGGVQLAGDASIHVQSGSLTITGALTETAPNSTMTKTGGGTLTLDNTATSYSHTTVSAGTLILRDTTSGAPPFAQLGFTSSVAVGASGTLVSERTVAGFTNRNAILGNNITGSGIININNAANTPGTTNGGWTTVGVANGFTNSGTLNINSGVFSRDYTEANSINSTATVNVAAGAAFGAGRGGNSTIGGLNGAGDVGALWSGGNQGSITIGNGNGSGTFTGTIRGSGAAADGSLEGGILNVIKTGTGVQYFDGNNTYSGTTTVQGGFLVISRPMGLGSAAMGTTVQNGATLQLENRGFGDVHVAGEAVTITGNGVSGNRGALANWSGNNSWGGNVQLAGNADIFVNSGSLTINGVISESVAGSDLSNSGAGTMIIGGNSSNTYTGNTIIRAGITRLGKTGGAVAIPGGTVTFGTGAGQPTMRMDQSNQFGPGTVINFINPSGAWSRLDLLGTNQTLAGVNTGTAGVLGGGVIQNGGIGVGPPGPATLTLNGSGSHLFHGHVRNIDGTGPNHPLNIIKEGTGTQTLVGPQITYTGTTTINQGTLVLRDTTGFASATTVGASGTLESQRSVAGFLNRSTILGNNITGSGTININNAANGAGTTNGGWTTVNTANGLNFSGTININSGVFSRDTTNANVINGTADVFVAAGAAFGAGRGGNSTIDVLTGFGDVGALWNGASQGSLTLGNGNGSGTFNGALRGNGGGPDGSLDGGILNVIKIGTGTQTIVGAGSNYTGTTTINDGTLALQDTTSFVSHSTVNANGTLSLNRAVNGFLSRDNITGLISGTGTVSIDNSTPGIGGGWVTFNGPSSGLSGFSGLVDINSGVLSMDNIAGAWSGNPDVNVDSRGLFAIRAQNISIDALTGDGDVINSWDGHGAAGDTLTVGAANGSGTFSGVIHGSVTGGADGTIEQGILNLVKTGTGTQTLTGANTYEGETIVNNGVLELDGGGSLQNRDVTINGGIFRQNSGVNNVTGAAGTNMSINSTGTYELNGGDLDFHDTDAGGDSTLNIAAGGTFDFNGGRLLDVTTIETNGGIFTQDDTAGPSRFVVGRDLAAGQIMAELTTINGGYDQLGGALALDIFGPLSHEIDMLLVDGNVELNGSVDVNTNFVDVIPFMWYDAIQTTNDDDGNPYLITANSPPFSVDGMTYWRIIDNPNGPGQIFQVAVPEPASVLLWGVLGALLFGYARRRKMRR